MADLARDASGPASSEPAGVAVQQAKQPASSDKGKLRVFISYSRHDLNFADQLDAALNLCRFECLIDRHDISGGEEWKRRLGNLISEADTVVFVLSPSSAGSPTCDWEVKEAARLNKRILPIVCRPLEGVSPPPLLQERNYVFFYEEPKFPGSGFGTGLANLVAALNTDLDWLREHTTFSAQWNGTRVADQPTGCCQATISSKRRRGRRVGPRMKRQPNHAWARAPHEHCASLLCTGKSNNN